MSDSVTNSRGPLALWTSMPLYVRILLGLLLGVLTGMWMGDKAIIFDIPSKLILQLLGALAPPLILVAVTHVLMTTEIRGPKIARLIWLLLLNTTVAIFIGLMVANTLQPGRYGNLQPEKSAASEMEEKKFALELLIDNIPKSLLGPLGDKSNVIGIIILAVTFGLALRRVSEPQRKLFQDLVEVVYQVMLTVLHWIIQLVPFGVFAIVAKVIGTQGFSQLKSLGVFVLAVILALLLQTCWYLIRIRLCSWVRPLDVLRGMRDALTMAFSTASSTATMPVTYAALKEKVGLREESASLGSLVGANFNNDGTALYEAMAALFVAQLVGQHLSLEQQLLVVITSIVASVGAAGIPEAGLVTMTLVFKSVGLPIEYIALLIAVDWFLDRCRTTINVLGDVNTSCLLDGHVRATPALAGAASPPSEPSDPPPA
ncbi:dicarboxylate/amino acid:cation symporter [Planctomicrobium sp. SH664]|uniref:dicarboxylate/amino acid:cation symporter n=1 Tax=Planctomicrobium sp. SH664 TaxID=3448125 RepID=UPI003F5C9A97